MNDTRVQISEDRNIALTGTESERMTAISLSMQPASTTRMKHRIMNPKVSVETVKRKRSER